uniref:Uncharacterized protein n=1 Tax=Arundo donax TaxID=35708 RepID=A0A0A9B9K4_ARUDO
MHGFDIFKIILVIFRCSITNIARRLGRQ